MRWAARWAAAINKPSYCFNFMKDYQPVVSVKVGWSAVKCGGLSGARNRWEAAHYHAGYCLPKLIAFLSFVFCSKNATFSVATLGDRIDNVAHWNVLLVEGRGGGSALATPRCSWCGISLHPGRAVHLYIDHIAEETKYVNWDPVQIFKLKTIQNSGPLAPHPLCLTFVYQARGELVTWYGVTQLGIFNCSTFIHSHWWPSELKTNKYKRHHEHWTLLEVVLCGMHVY